MRALPLALYTKGYKLSGDENAETEKGRSTTLEGKKFTCPKKTETFECDAAKRVPVEFNRGTSYKINDLKSPSDEKESEIYCRKNICSVKKNKLYGRVQILEKNATRMTFQMMNLNDSLRVRSCIGHRVDLSCSSFQQFLQTPRGLGAFLKKADGSEDITFCNEKGNCTCMDGCREYKGRLEPGYKSVNMRTVKMEDAELDFMFYFERDDPRKQKLRECVFKIDPVVCPGKPTRTLEVITGRPLQENESNRTKHPSTISHNVTPGTLEVKRGILFLCLILAIFTFPG
ncbi:hypothetical protein pdam_00007267 [Pocillopora damicornis]|uniref:Uncharacterized protein n=1 Tax=Pocillopora damicornis TaxID=46731 RepID=A0A3M6UMW7_POCDA|nr:hypothetical protein pdam_00007267 [Pocillopora damicornis]